MRVNMLEETIIEEVTKIIKVAETKIMKEMHSIFDSLATVNIG